MTTNLFGMTLSQLQELCDSEGLPKYTAKQICDWLYTKHVTEINAMSNISIANRTRLQKIARIGRHAPIDCQVSQDGTKKYLFEIVPHTLSNSLDSQVDAEEADEDFDLFDLDIPQHRYVEAVFIPDDDRATLCISCQLGCRMGCHFCVTGRQGFHGDLDAGEILNQIFSIPEFRQITNVVYMGMGEPMDNYDNVLCSTRVLTASWGLAWSPKRITVSSVGVLPKLERFVRESLCHVAVSLHNPCADERAMIMPMQKPYPIADVVQMLKRFDWSGQRRISFEYIMFRDLNDDLKHAETLVRLLRGLPCRVNLIRFHSSPGTPFNTSPTKRIVAFEKYLNTHGITCTLRASRGEDIMAACGLLAGKKHQDYE